MRVCLALFSYGGIEGELLDSLAAELQVAAQSGVQVYYSRIHGDALISRSRSKAMSAFLKDTDADVLFMLDHDLEWPPGQLLATCAKAHQLKAMVSGMYATRAKGAGFAGRAKGSAVRVRIGADELHEAEYLPGGFIAIPRLVVEEVLKAGQEAQKTQYEMEAHGNSDLANCALTECLYNDGTNFYDFFRPIVVPSTLVSGANEYLSEDWSFSWRARRAAPGRPQYLWALPFLRHWGKYGFTMAESAREVEPAKKVLGAP